MLPMNDFGFISPTPTLIQAAAAAAFAAWPLVGSGDRVAADRAAVDAMRAHFNGTDFGGVVVIGEGAKDQAPMLYNGEVFGTGTSPLAWDIAVDPVDGTRLAAEGLPGAVAVVAASEAHTMMNCPDVYYMQKMVSSSAGLGVLDITKSASENIRSLAAKLNKPITEINVAVINKPINQNLIQEILSVGANWVRFDEGDVAMAVAAAMPDSEVDLLMGVGGNPEGVVSAVAVRVLGGFMQARLAPRSDHEIGAMVAAGFSQDQVLTLSDLVSGERLVFVMCAITEGLLLDGIATIDGELKMQTLVLDSLVELPQVLDVTLP